jgi:hypothetical protein
LTTFSTRAVSEESSDRFLGSRAALGGAVQRGDIERFTPAEPPGEGLVPFLVATTQAYRLEAAPRTLALLLEAR